LFALYFSCNLGLLKDDKCWFWLQQQYCRWSVIFFSNKGLKPYLRKLSRNSHVFIFEAPLNFEHETCCVCKCILVYGFGSFTCVNAGEQESQETIIWTFPPVTFGRSVIFGCFILLQCNVERGKLIFAFELKELIDHK